MAGPCWSRPGGARRTLAGARGEMPWRASAATSARASETRRMTPAGTPAVASRASQTAAVRPRQGRGDRGDHLGAMTHPTGVGGEAGFGGFPLETEHPAAGEPLQVFADGQGERPVGGIEELIGDRGQDVRCPSVRLAAADQPFCATFTSAAVCASEPRCIPPAAGPRRAVPTAVACLSQLKYRHLGVLAGDHVRERDTDLHPAPPRARP